jgi:hypothetical protein
MVLLVRAVRTGSLRSARREAVIAGALAGVCAGTHLVAFVVVAAFAGCYLLTAFAFQRTRAVLAVGLAAGLVTAGIGLIVLLAPGGTLGFKGTADTATYASISAQLGLPRTFDPTWFLAKGSLQPPPRAAGAFAVSPSSLGKEFVRRITDQKRLSRRGAALVAVVGLASLGLVLWRGDRVLKIAAIAAVLLAVTLLAVALLFSWRYNVYVLSHFGPRRLYDYEAIPTIVLMVAAIETLLAMLGRTPAGTTRAWLAPASATVIVAVAALVLLPRDTAPTKDRAYLTSALKPLSWIADNVPCSGRILADRRTLGTFQTMTGHAGLLEGMGPYFRPDVLQPALAQLFAARAFFAHPDSVAYLQQQGVAAVVVSGVSQSIGGAAKVGPVDEAALASSPFLQVVASSPAATVYRVVGFDPSWTAGMPTAAGRPGFECRAA